ncbi:MAG: EscN/YscN/HrcN family type III secretion system ATPase [Phycisphaerales bacterium]
MSLVADAIETLRTAQPVAVTGRVAAVRGMTVLVRDLPAPVGALVEIGRDEPTPAEVVGFTDDLAILMPLGATVGVQRGDPARVRRVSRITPVGDALVGRIVDALGRPLDDHPVARGLSSRPLVPPPVSALKRPPIDKPLRTGVRAIDLMMPLGLGQRLGVFAGPGVGKSTLLGTIARHSSAEINVIALIGERGREVREFVERVLGAEGLARSVVVVATGDESPLMRVRAALAATSIAEHFRDRGRRVLLMMDSVTRFAHAQRQIGLSAGEPPATKGYTPGVFASLALLLERAGIVERSDAATERRSDEGDVSNVKAGRPVESSSLAPPHRAPPSLRRSVAPSLSGSITALYTILVEGDDMTEPIADAARGILDGHAILSRRLAQRSHYPAIDVLDSVSRVADEVSDAAHTAARRQIARLLALYREVEDLVQIGAYARGSNAETDVAIELRAPIEELLRQGPGESEPFEASRSRLIALAVKAGEEIAGRKK